MTNLLRESEPFRLGPIIHKVDPTSNIISWTRKKLFITERTEKKKWGDKQQSNEMNPSATDL